MGRKRICWVTPDHFVDVDLMVIPNLLHQYDIHWLVIFYKHHRFKESDFLELKKQYSNLTIEFLYCNIPGKDIIRKYFSVAKLKRKILSIPSDLYYLDYVPVYPYHIQLFKGLPSQKTIFVAHDGSVKDDMRPKWLIKWSFKKAYKHALYVNMFSQSQANLFARNFPGPNIFVIPLAPKTVGISSNHAREDCISFLMFGAIRENKNIDILIDAANQLYEEGIRGFKVSINGVWELRWNIYDRIKYTEIFEISLGLVPNHAIPDLFGRNHYCVYPYKEMSQSGALKLAFGYHNPVICSNLPGFVDEVVDGVDGYIFKTQDVEDLKRVMRKCIDDGMEGYRLLKQKMTKHVNEYYSPQAIATSYIEMIEEVKDKDNSIS